VKILISWAGKSERYADSISKAEAVPVLQNEKSTGKRYPE